MMLHGLVELHISLSEHVSNLWWGLSPSGIVSALKLGLLATAHAFRPVHSGGRLRTAWWDQGK